MLLTSAVVSIKIPPFLLLILTPFLPSITPAREAPLFAEIVIAPFSVLIESALTVLVLTSWLNNSFARAAEFIRAELSLIPEII